MSVFQKKKIVYEVKLSDVPLYLQNELVYYAIGEVGRKNKGVSTTNGLLAYLNSKKVSNLLKLKRNLRFEINRTQILESIKYLEELQKTCLKMKSKSEWK